MTHKEIFGGAEWITPAQDLSSAVFRKEFDLISQKAAITICGLGYFILYINGRRVSCDELVPAYSDYIPRNGEKMRLIYPLSDRQDNRIYCLRYDISDYATIGRNVLGVMVGGGYFHQTDRTAEGNMDYGNIRLCYRITAPNEEIISDGTTLYKQGFIKTSSLFYGEKHDYNSFDYNWNTLSADRNGWLAPEICGGMKEIPMHIQKCGKDKITRVLQVKKLKDFGDYSVYDAGENITGYAVAKCRKKGEKVVMTFAELLNADGTLSCDSAGWEQVASDEFITDGITHELHPYLLWHGFRYFSLTNNAEAVEVREIHTDMAVTSEFECSDETLNWIYKTYIHTQLSNIHSAVPTDCPHRERLGYTGDGQLCAPAAMLTLDSQELYRKWIDDIIDCQDKTTGHVQHTAPFSGGGGGPAGWGGAIITVIYHYTKYYGDLSLLKKYYKNILLFIDYMESRCENGLIEKEEEKGWCLGDWCTPEKIEIPEDFVNTCMYVNELKMAAYCGELLNENTDKINELIDFHRESIIKKYAPDESGSFLGGLQGADFFARICGIANEKTDEAIKEKYSRLKCFDTGIFGTFYACKTLFELGAADIAISMLGSHEENHSFGFMKDSGATTLWENWNGEASNNHPMFGACVSTFFENILGIRQAENSCGFEKVIIAPAENTILSFAKGYITTERGKTAVEYRKNGNKTEFIIDLCGGADGELIYGGRSYPLHGGRNSINA